MSGKLLYVQADNEMMVQAKFNAVDSHYLRAFGIDLLYGQAITELDANSHNVLMNQAAARQLGYLSPEDAVSKVVLIEKEAYTIKGIVRDYTNQPFSTSVRPQLLTYL